MSDNFRPRNMSGMESQKITSASVCSTSNFQDPRSQAVTPSSVQGYQQPNSTFHGQYQNFLSNLLTISNYVSTQQAEFCATPEPVASTSELNSGIPKKKMKMNYKVKTEPFEHEHDFEYETYAEDRVEDAENHVEDAGNPIELSDPAIAIFKIFDEFRRSIRRFENENQELRNQLKKCSKSKSKHFQKIITLTEPRLYDCNYEERKILSMKKRFEIVAGKFSAMITKSDLIQMTTDLQTSFTKINEEMASHLFSKIDHKFVTAKKQSEFDSTKIIKVLKEMNTKSNILVELSTQKKSDFIEMKRSINQGNELKKKSETDESNDKMIKCLDKLDQMTKQIDCDAKAKKDSEKRLEKSLKNFIVENRSQTVFDLAMKIANVSSNIKNNLDAQADATNANQIKLEQELNKFDFTKSGNDLKSFIDQAAEKILCKIKLSNEKALSKADNIKNILVAQAHVTNANEIKLERGLKKLDFTKSGNDMKKYIDQAAEKIICKIKLSNENALSKADVANTNQTKLIQELNNQFEVFTETLDLKIMKNFIFSEFETELKKVFVKMNEKIVSDLKVEIKKPENYQQVKHLNDMLEKEKKSNNDLMKTNTRLYENLVNSKDEIIKLKDQIMKSNQKTCEPEIVHVKNEIKPAEDVYETKDFNV